VQGPDAIIGRNWLDSPAVSYYKSGGQLVLAEANVVNKLADATVVTLGNEFDSLHVVSTEVELERAPLDLSEFKFVNEAVSAAERSSLSDLVNEYRDCFATSLEELGCTPFTQMDILEVTGSKPVMCKPYKTTAADRAEIEGIVSDWKRCGLVVETRSPYASPVLLVKQSAGKHRLCVDYRRLNKQTLRQHFPLPDMNEQLHSLGNSKLFAQLDLASGYLQIPLTDEAAAKTAFITEDTTGQFTRMPFGLSGAVAEFTRLMRHVLGPLHGKIVRNYLDDMVIDAVDWDDMLSKLRLVFERLRSACLTLKPSKCAFGAEQIEFLGFIIGGGLIQPGELKTRAISDFPTPVDVTSLKRFLGLTSFFRRFVEGYAIIAESLTRLTKKNADFLWSDEQDSAFRVLKDRLTEPPVLTMFDPNAEVTELHTDASSLGLGAMLLQSKKTGGSLKLIYCISKKTSDSESKYHSSKLELMCVVWAMSKLRQFLLGLQFVVYTDCQALVYLNSFKATNAQVARWHDVLQEYDFTIKYRPGNRMCHVDALSRAPVSSTGDKELPFDIELEDRWDVCVLLTIEDKVRMCQVADQEVSSIIQRLNADPVDYNLVDKSFALENGLLYRRVNGRLLFVMPRAMRKGLVVAAHNLKGHPAVDRTVANILQDFWFVKMRRYVAFHIKMCFECLMVKGPRGKQPGLLHPIAVGKRPFDTVHLDHVGPLVITSNGSKYVLTFVDNFTKYVNFYPVAITSADETLQCVKKFVNAYGLPQRLISDRGTCFTARVFENDCQGIKHILTSTRHP